MINPIKLLFLKLNIVRRNNLAHSLLIFVVLRGHCISETNTLLKDEPCLASAIKYRVRHLQPRRLLRRRLHGGLMILLKAVKAYARIVERNAATLSNFESTLRSLTYLIPGKESLLSLPLPL